MKHLSCLLFLLLICLSVPVLVGCDPKPTIDSQIQDIEKNLTVIQDQLSHKKLANANYIAHTCDELNATRHDLKTFMELCNRDAYQFGPKILKWQERIAIAKQLASIAKPNDQELTDEIARIHKGMQPEVYNASLVDWLQMVDALKDVNEKHPARFLVGNFLYGQWFQSNNGSYRWQWNQNYALISLIDQGPYYFHRWIADSQVTYFSTVELPTISPKLYQETIDLLKSQNQKQIDQVVANFNKRD